MEWRIIPLESELDFAPTTKEELEQAVGSLACIGDCRYNVPLQDRHHLIFGEDLSESEKLLKSHPDFITTICRCVHQLCHKTWDRSQPVADEFAVGYLLSSPLNLGANQRRRLKELRRAS